MKTNGARAQRLTRHHPNAVTTSPAPSTAKMTISSVIAGVLEIASGPNEPPTSAFTIASSA